MSEGNVELARRGYEAAMRGELEVIADLLAPDVRWHGGDPSFAGSCHDREDVLAVVRRARGKRIGELIDVVDAGEKVVVIMRPAAGEEDDRPGRLVANLTTSATARWWRWSTTRTPRARSPRPASAEGPYPLPRSRAPGIDGPGGSSSSQGLRSSA